MPNQGHRVLRHLISWGITLSVWATGSGMLSLSAASGQEPAVRKAMVIQFRSKRQVRTMVVAQSCHKWSVLRDIKHPQWPSVYHEEKVTCTRASQVESGVPESAAASFAALSITHAGEKILLHYQTRSADVNLLVTALQDGAAGDVIRFRSALGGGVLWGELHAGAPAELVLRSTDAVADSERTSKESSW